jgi:hypothetical protein
LTAIPRKQAAKSGKCTFDQPVLARPHTGKLATTVAVLRRFAGPKAEMDIGSTSAAGRFLNPLE